mgnify:CR=1 FL=1
MRMITKGTDSTFPELPGARVTPMTADLSTLLATVTTDAAMQDLDKLDPSASDETNQALRLALIAMTEADRRIRRQQRRIAHLESLSSTDELTGLTNRRGFRTELQRTLASAARHDTGGVIVMIDLDRFKEVNDTHGHSAGNALLIDGAHTLKGWVRESDVVSRLGGDEFAVLMAGADAAESERRLIDLEQLLNGKTIMWRDRALVVHASIGYTEFGAQDSEAELMDRADKRMYAVKAQNRITLNQPSRLSLVAV